jgi:hypothetical protein
MNPPNLMRGSQPPAVLNATLQFVLAADIPAQHRAVLVEMLTRALREEEAGSSMGHGELPPGWEWQPHEIMLMQTSLDGKVAKSWQHADELVMLLAAQLRRDLRSVRAKATELGLSAAVDYRVAKALAQDADEQFRT